MPGPRHLLAIDQGTTSTRAVVFDHEGAPRATAQQELPQVFPRPGWVEHDPEAIWQATLDTCRTALVQAGLSARELAGVGITNQRETVVLWERATGRPLHHAIVWQDRRTAATCERLAADGLGRRVQERTGLRLDPYFSATKLAWLLEHVQGARARAARGELAAGTIDCFLLWRLTGGRVHATDATNASRTLLFDIHTQDWSDELLEVFGVPRSLLPEVKDNAAEFGNLDAELLGAPVPVLGMAGDQQAAALGQACWETGTSKCTYGTGAFLLLNTGERAVTSRNRLLTTVAFRLDGLPHYAMEGSIFSAGSTMQWLRDGLGLLEHAARSEELAAAADPARAVQLVPAFAGLGAPHWDARARGALLGLTRDTTAADVVRAGLAAVAFQTADLVDAMTADGCAAPVSLRVDGGMVANGWLMQFLADVLDVPVERPVITETTALGAALLAGLQAGLWSSPADVAARWRRERRFEPAMTPGERARQRGDWAAAVRRVLSSTRSEA